jgi:flavodoxin
MRAGKKEPSSRIQRLNGFGGALTMAAMNALIVYHTVSGHTKRAAEDIADGLRSEGVSSQIQAANAMTDWDVAGVALVIVGSPCHAGSVALRSGLPGPMRSILRRLRTTSLAGKLGAAFSVHCAYGGHRTVRAIEKHLASCGARIPEPGVVVRAGVPLSVMTGPLASEEDRRRLREFGCSLARAAKAIGNSDPPAAARTTAKER